MRGPLALPSLIPPGVFADTLGAAWNDPISNIVWLGGSPDLDAAKVLTLLNHGTFPTDCLAPFYHEGTHHLCFDSPVGNVLLAIESFSRMAWWKTLECRQEDRVGRLPCSDNPVCFNRRLLRQILTLITPLAEGIALYGELDAAPGAAPAASRILIDALSVFFDARSTELARAHIQALRDQGSPQPGDSHWAEEVRAGVTEGVMTAFGAWLRDERMRLGSSFTKARELLASGGSAASGSVYEAGYDWVTRTVADITRHSELAKLDTDLVLAFLCAYIFHDWRLASLLSTASWTVTGGQPTVAATALAQYLKTRMRDLRSADVGEMVDAYSKELSTGDIRRCSFLHYSREAHEHLAMQIAPQAGAHELYWAAPKSQRDRLLFRFGVLAPDRLLVVPKEKRVTCEVGGSTMALPLLTGGLPFGHEDAPLETGGDESGIELIVLRGRVFVCFFMKGSVVAVTDRHFRPIPDMDAEEVFGDMSSFAHSEGWRRHYWELLDPPEGSSCRRYLNEGLAEIERWATRIYE